MADAALPTFLVIGAMKAGTTSLYRYLRAHPEVFVAERKELDFFSRDDLWSRGVAWYESQFAAHQGETARGEASTSYSKHPEFPGVPERIKATVPEVRLVYCVRDPIERIESQYRHAVAMGGSAPLDQVALTEEYLGPSCYGRQLARYLEVFPAERVLVIDAAELRANQTATLARLFDHIGVDPEFRDSSFEQEHYVSAERRTVRGPIMNVARSRFVRPLTDRVPSHLKLRLGRSVVASRTVSASEVRSRVDEKVRAELHERLAGDVAMFRSLVGPVGESWSV
jgi:hypothetical protein